MGICCLVMGTHIKGSSRTISCMVKVSTEVITKNNSIKGNIARVKSMGKEFLSQMVLLIVENGVMGCIVRIEILFFFINFYLFYSIG